MDSPDDHGPNLVQWKKKKKKNRKIRKPLPMRVLRTAKKSTPFPYFNRGISMVDKDRWDEIYT